MDRLATALATGLYAGFFPLAPATFATAVFLALYALVPGGEVLAHPIACLATLVASIPASTRVEKRYGTDPHCVVIDEIVGIQIALVGATPTLWGIAAAFVVFRVFDVWKPFPVGRLQALPGGWGVVADDVAAGLYTRVVITVASLAVPSLGRFA